jgi:hypothetical protein
VRGSVLVKATLNDTLGKLIESQRMKVLGE